MQISVPFSAKKLLVALMLMMLAYCITAPPAHGYQGKVQLFCAPQVNQQVDPLADFGVDPTLHLHTPVGALDSFGANETLDVLEGATASSCNLASDRSQLWAPTPLQADGSTATIENIAYYLINGNGQTLSDPATYNPGLRFLLGKPSCTSTSCSSATFICLPSGGWGGRTIPTLAECPSGGYQETFNISKSPQCWGGVSLGEGFGTSDPAADLTVVKPCDTPYTIPQVVMTMTVAHDGVGGYLSSDYVPSEGTDNRTTCPGCSAHFDYAFNFIPSALRSIITMCMYQPTINQNFLTCREHDGSLYLNDPSNNKAENGENGEPYELVTN